MLGKITIIGCPKLDSIDYSEKLTQIIQNNNIQSVTVVRMEVPCCGGLELAAKKALQKCDGCTHGSSLLRRTGISCQKSVAGKRKIHSLADCYDFVGW